MRALVVDDSKTTRFMIGRILREKGFEVFEAVNGVEGLTRLEEIGAPDVATVDWNMPEMSGIEFVRSMRAEATYAPTKVVMITTESEAEQIAEAMAAGANGFVTKPFNRQSIEDKLQEIGVS